MACGNSVRISRVTEKRLYGDFDSAFGYNHFDIEIRRRWRYIFPAKVQSYLAAVRKTTEHRRLVFPSSSRLYRGQRGCDMKDATTDLPLHVNSLFEFYVEKLEEP